MTETALSKRRWVRRSEQDWRELFAHFEQSGRTRAEFCREHGLVLSSFSRWWRKVRQNEERLPTPTDGALFVELSSQASSESVWDVELELGPGMVLRVRRPAC